ncbi:MAG: SpoIIIAH-like family protein [Syntrophomonadaceae bacterium]|jgi:stage III sporulation protein AH
MVINKKKTLIIIAAMVLVFALSTFMSQWGDKDPQAYPDNLPDNNGTVDVNIDQQQKKDRVRDFFAEYRMERERIRSKEIEMLREILDDHASEEKIREAAALRLVEISTDMEREMKVENLVKARGYNECVVIIQSENTTVVIESDTARLDKEEEIKDLVSSAIQVSSDSISIIVREPSP